MPPTVSATPFLDPWYYFDLDLAPVRAIAECENVFAIKGAVTDHLDKSRRSLRGDVHPDADIGGDVIVEAGATVGAGAIIVGPARICTGAVVGRGLVRDHSIIGPHSHVGYGAEVVRSVLMVNSRVVHFGYVGDSVLGSHVNVGAGSVLTPLRVDRPVVEPAVEEITITVDGQQVRTGHTKFGSILGDRVQLPALTSVAPGTLIGPDATIYPSRQLGGVLPAGARVRT